jgi:DNA-directed RNA polymerase specialized sigma24 family protein
MSEAGIALAGAASARSDGHSATETTDATEIEECIEPLLLGLDAPYREAIRMTTLQGMTQGAAAKQASISLSGMKSRVQRGRGKLRILLETYCAAELEASGRPIQSALATESLWQTDK